MWKVLRKDSVLEEPTPLLSQVRLGCTQREPEIDHRALQAEADPSRRLTTTEVTN